MGFFGMRFDLRNPSFAGTTTAERYAAMLDMVQWADERGFYNVTISEHHGSPDGYMPSPLPVAAAIAARTTNIRINIAALVVPFYDPLRLAEDIAVVDQLSNGRLDVVLAYGYLESEFAMFGKSLGDRVRTMASTVETLRKAWTGQPFHHDGREVVVTPTPHQAGGPPLTLGGSSERTARRAAHLGDGYLPSSPDLYEHYRDEMRKLGKPDPGPWPGGGDTSFIHVATDADAGWAEIEPYALHEVNGYGSWMSMSGIGAEGGYAPTIDGPTLRATGQYRCLTPDELVAEVEARGPWGFTLFHPMMGGIPPEIGWKSLRLAEQALPDLRCS